MRKSHLLILIALLCVPFQLRGQINEGFEAGIPGTWTFSGPGAALDGTADATSGITPPQGSFYAWISTGCTFSAGTTCPDVATVSSTPQWYGSLYLGAGTNGLPPAQALGSPTTQVYLTSPVFSLNAGDTISFDVNFITTDGTYSFADFAVVQLIPVSPEGSAINLFVANTTCSTCTAVPPVGLTGGVGTLYPAVRSFSGTTATFGSTTYGNVAKFGGGAGGPSGWIQVSSKGPATGSYQLVFTVSHVGDTQYPSALGIDNIQTNAVSAVTTPKQTVTAGNSNTFTDTGGDFQTVTFPAGTNFGDAVTTSMAVSFIEIDPTVFNSTRLPATAPNTWSGGTAVPAGTTCTPISPDNKCIVIENLCFAADGSPVAPCNIVAPSGSLIKLFSKYQTSAPELNPLLAIATDGQNDWANITTTFTSGDNGIGGGTGKLNSDEFIGDLPQFFGFSSPVSDPNPGVTVSPTPPFVINTIKAGQTVPVAWQFVDGNGVGITGLTLGPANGGTGTVNLTAVPSSVCTAAATTDTTITVSASGSSGLQDLGGGHYQFNWNTKGIGKGACVDLAVDPGDGTLHHAYFLTK